MRKYVNEVGSLTDPFWYNVVVLGLLTPDGQPPRLCYNAFDFRRDDPDPPFDADNVLAMFKTAYEALVLPNVAQQYSIVGYNGFAMDDPSSVLAFVASAATGAIDDDFYAGDDAIYMQLKTGFRSRNFFGSKHFGGATESHIISGYLTGAGITAWDAIRDGLLSWAVTGLTDADGNVWKFTLLSRTLSDLSLSPAVFTGADITAILLNYRVGTMGRRRGNRDAH